MDYPMRSQMSCPEQIDTGYLLPQCAPDLAGPPAQ